MPGMTASEALLKSIEELPVNLRPALDVEAVIKAAAGKLASAEVLEVILTLLGPGPTYWSKPAETPLVFPRDHAVHPGRGPEWYWLTAVMDVQGSDFDQIAFVLSMERQQPISPQVQAKAGWTDAEAQLVFSYACVIHRSRSGGRIYTRRPNLAWPPLAGTTAMSAPGEPFLFGCGPDSLSGSKDVLPLTVTIDDQSPGEDALQINVTCTSGLPAPSAFFLQGENGVTPKPRSGTYYSWPQLAVSGTVAIGGKTYTVSGKGWLDHEMMYGAVPPLSPVTPPPENWTAPAGIYGWSFCDFNFANGDALVLAGFQEGPLVPGLVAPYGFYLTTDGTSWNKTYVVGEIGIDALMPLTADCMLPVAWTCVIGAESPLFAATIETDPVWYDGSFLAVNKSVQGETPVNLTLSMGDEAVPGTGYCESVGYEPPARFMERALAFLAANS